MSLLTVNDLGKAYRTYRSEWHRFANWFGISIKPREEHWVLRHVNFDIEPGEAIGIIGQNGAGKSTLLKMIAGTLQPTEGVVKVNGRVAAILELGMGFNPDLTGRQNVKHAAGLMGLSLAQIQQAIPGIEAFAEIGEYFDEPVRTYSSGMQMRVAFAITTAWAPEILIVDEALAIGDAYFQRKCFHRIEQFKQSGGTLLFVSHDPNMVKSLCDRAILIDNGNVISDGKPKDVIDLYQAILAKLSDTGNRDISFTKLPSSEKNEIKATSITTNGDAELVEFRLLNSKGEDVVYFESENELTVRYKIRFKKNFERPAFGLIVRDKIGRSIFETSTYAMGVAVSPISVGREVEVDFTFNFNLKAGLYAFSVGVANNGFSKSEFEELSLLVHDVQQLQVIESADSIYYGGVFNMNPVVVTRM
jgi:ABC-type polysaccharide/polyol phosphate transport system ATPase subunit